jgi:RHS repeat-associated protein
MLGEGMTALTYYQAQVKTYADYYPFGMEMHDRTASSPNYRYGFNGKEKDQAGEFSAGQTHYDYGFRIYNPVWGKFLSVDPLSPSYPWYTPYQFAGNSPIMFIDQDGLERVYAADGTFIHQYGWNFTDLRVVSDLDVADVIRKDPNAFKNRLDDTKLFEPAKPFDGSELWHEAAILTVKAGAGDYKIKAALLKSGKRKQAYLEASSVLTDFATGGGAKERTYTFNDPFFQFLNKNNQLILEVVEDFEARLAELGISAGEYFRNNPDFRGGYEFSPDHAWETDGIYGVLESIEKHLEAISENPIAIVIGGMSYKIWSTKQGDLSQGYEIEFSNTTGKGSLLLHQATDLKSSRETPLSNKKQTFRGHISEATYSTWQLLLEAQE